jgi:hypothetical protein
MAWHGMARHESRAAPCQPSRMTRVWRFGRCNVQLRSVSVEIDRRRWSRSKYTDHAAGRVPSWLESPLDSLRTNVRLSTIAMAAQLTYVPCDARKNVTHWLAQATVVVTLVEQSSRHAQCRAHIAPMCQGRRGRARTSWSLWLLNPQIVATQCGADRPALPIRRKRTEKRVCAQPWGPVA